MGREENFDNRIHEEDDPVEAGDEADDEDFDADG